MTQLRWVKASERKPTVTGSYCLKTIESGICCSSYFDGNLFDDCRLQEIEWLEEVEQPSEQPCSITSWAWECPRCHKVHSPFSLICDCFPNTVTISGLTNEPSEQGDEKYDLFVLAKDYIKDNPSKYNSRDLNDAKDRGKEIGFIAGYNKAKSQLSKEVSAGGWISVDEMLPAKDMKVQWLYEDTREDYGYYYKDKGGFATIDACSETGITHWRPF